MKLTGQLLTQDVLILPPPTQSHSIWVGSRASLDDMRTIIISVNAWNETQFPGCTAHCDVITITIQQKCYLWVQNEVTLCKIKNLI
jgi:hypothetical protein